MKQSNGIGRLEMLFSGVLSKPISHLLTNNSQIREETANMGIQIWQ